MLLLLLGLSRVVVWSATPFLVLYYNFMDKMRLLFILLVGRLYVCCGVYFIDVPGWWYTPSGSVGYDEECDVYTYALDDFI